MLYSEGEYERNVCPAEMGRIIDRSRMDQMGVGEMGIEDAIDGVWKQVEKRTYGNTCLLRFMADNCSSNTMGPVDTPKNK
jgi:hypothetical protein